MRPRSRRRGRGCGDFTYSHQQGPANARNPVYTFLLSVTQSGYKRTNGGYQKSSLPPVVYEYTVLVTRDPFPMCT
jgi:hypothetical protein